jgi:hypothetical protein
MNGVIVFMIPSTWKSVLRDVIVVMVVTRDGGTVDGGGKGEEKEESTSKGGEHRAGREGAHKGAIAGNGSPYKVALGTDERPLPSNCPIPIFPFSPVTRLGAQAPVPLAWPDSSPAAGCHSTATFVSRRVQKLQEKEKGPREYFL